MRQLKVFAVYDSKVEAFLQPFIMQTKGQAVRAFTDSCNDPQSNFWKHPEDFTLFELGSWDEVSGAYTNLTAKVAIGGALEFRKAEGELAKAAKPEWSPNLMVGGKA